MPCPKSELLQQLVDESLPADQKDALQAHLSTCTTCQAEIERLVASGPTWDKTARNLGSAPTSDETALLAAMKKLREPSTPNVDAGAVTQAPIHPDGASVDDDFSFLQSSTKPGSIGRLDRYEIESVVGKGGFGVVLKAFDESLHRVVAIKIMAPQIAANGAARKRFIKEARAAAAVTHEHVVAIYEVNADAKIPYLAMQFISGMTLHEKIEKQGSLSVKEILRIGLQVAEGLAAAHKQSLIHRDIKPGNILLENGVERVKITDFGLARSKDDASVTQSGTVAGTPMFMSPEQASGETVDHRSDLFSLGSVMYVMCTGKPPFRANSTLAVMKRVAEDTPSPIRSSNDEIPEWLCAIVEKLHAKKPDERYQTAAEVAEVLGQRLADVQAGRAIGGRAEGRKAPVDETAKYTSPRTQAPDTPRSPARRQSRWTLAIILALVVGLPALFASVLVLGWLFWQDSGRPNANPALPPMLQDNPGPILQVDPPKLQHNPGPILAIADRDGWVPLFNGKDLTGWVVPVPDNSNWKVDKLGRLVGRAQPHSVLYTERDDYENFHLRAEVTLESGAGGIYFRSALARKDGELPAGYKVQIGDKPPTGTVMITGSDRKGADPLFVAPKLAGGAQETVTIDVIAQDNWLTVKVNSKLVIERETRPAPYLSYKRGRIVLEAFEPKSVIAFKKIEIKELPASQPAPIEPGWISLFNGKDLAGWKIGAGPQDAWKVDAGILHGAKGGTLGTGQKDFANFHLRMEVNTNLASDISLGLRSDSKSPGFMVSLGRANRPPVNYAPGEILYPSEERIFFDAVPNLAKPDEWYTLDVIANGPHVVVKINSKVAVELRDKLGAATKGPIALIQYSGSGPIQIRKIEIKELPSSEPPVAVKPRPQGNHALFFDGKSAYVDIPTLRYETDQPVTIEARVKFDKAMEITETIAGGYSPKSALLLGRSAGKSIIFLARQDLNATFAGLDDKHAESKWLHVAGVWDGKKARLYIDGKLLPKSMTNKVTPENAAIQQQNFILGAEIFVPGIPMHGFFHGTMDEVRISKIARYATDFKPEHRFVPDKDTVALYHCDEGEGDKLIDASGNKHHGNVVGVKWVKSPELPADVPAKPRVTAADLTKVKPAYEALFKNVVPNWLIEKKDFYDQGFANGRYFIAIDPGASRSCFCPAEPVGDFVCEVVGRAIGSPAVNWALEIQNVAQDRYLYFKLNGKEELEIIAIGKGAANFKKIGPIRHPAIKPGEEFNTLRIAMRGTTIEVLVNGVPVCEPVITDFVKTPATFGVLAFADKDKASRAEFERLTIWSPVQSKVEGRQAPLFNGTDLTAQQSTKAGMLSEKQQSIARTYGKNAKE